MSRKLLAMIAIVALVLAACGSRAEDDSSGDQGLSGSADSGEDSGGEGGDAAVAGGDTVGTIDNPCSEEAAQGSPPAGTPGVSEDTIRIGVISDRENPQVQLPTVGIQEGVEAFVDFCNESGGIGGRQLELVTYDSEIARVADVTEQACQDDLFALVGDGSVQDQQGIDTRVGCDLPEVAAYSATAARATSELFWQPIPGTLPTKFNVGPCRYIADQFPDASKKAAMAFIDLPASADRAAQIVANCEDAAGFDFVVEEGFSVGESNFGPVVSQMDSAGVKYFSMVADVATTRSLVEEIDAQGLDLDVIDLGQQYYDPAVASSPVFDGAYVLTNTVPFFEADQTPALALYQEYLDKVGGDQTALGVQAFSAGLLFATATDALGSDLTREALADELDGITSWDGGGLHMEADPGENKHNECFLYLKVADGEFQREHPDEGFDCSEDYVRTSEQSFGGG